MDIPAFGTVYGQVSQLPYASGFAWTPADGPKTFSTCRAIVVRATNNASNTYVEFNDGQGQLVEIAGFGSNTLLPAGITSISGGSINSAVVLY